GSGGNREHSIQDHLAALNVVLMERLQNIQAAILERWQLENPWKWKEKHLKWFLNSYLRNRKAVTVYSYYLTSRYIVMRMGRPWRLDNPSLGISRRADTSEG
ncbi:hypothetical protein V2K58_26295, partial [Pseudomonas alliivorans]|nr:hypothetical protein [Pseudomonas alliivorans]